MRVPIGDGVRRSATGVVVACRGVRMVAPSLLVAMSAVLCMWLAWQSLARGGGRRDEVPLFAVPAGNVPVAAPSWVSRTGEYRVIIPAQAVGYYPAGSSPSGNGARVVVDVLHVLADESDRWRTFHGFGVNAGSLRYTVEVRSVQVRRVSDGYVAVQGISPWDLVSARFIGTLGNEDVVTGAAPSPRLVDYPVPPPASAVVTSSPKRNGDMVITVVTDRPGAVGYFYPVMGDHRIRMRFASRTRNVPGAAGLEVTVPALSLPAEGRDLLTFSRRPRTNIGWVSVARAGGNPVNSAVRY